MNLKEALEKLFAEYAPPNDVSQFVEAIRTTNTKHPPRSPEKAEWLRSRGIDPEEGFPELR